MNLPDDVIEFLDNHPDTAAAVTNAVRVQMQRAESRRYLEAVQAGRLPEPR